MRAVLLVVLVACSASDAARPVSPGAELAGSPASAVAPPAPAIRPDDPPPPPLRLPGDVKPTRYALELTLVPDQPTAAGRIRIAAEVVKAARVVWLNATGLTIGRAALDGRPARVIPGGDDFIGLTLDRELAPGALTIDVSFTASIDRVRSRGLYSEREGKETYLYTFFEATDARRAFPCFDEPSYKVPWQVTLHVREDHVAIGNANTLRETALPGGMKRVEFDATRPLPSYLVAFVVGPFELVDGGSAGRRRTLIRFIIPGGRADELGYALEVTPKVVAALEDYFDMSYPYGKLDVAVVPRYWGTMEHPGIVAMGQPLTLIRPDQATRTRKQAYTQILAHELSHYWFGNLVTMAWWDDTWLNESLGTWSDLNITEAAEPSWRTRDGRVASSVDAMAADETLAARAIRRPVTTPEDIAASFDSSIIYGKGAAMFQMFESFVSPGTWRGFIKRYLEAHAWGNASADDFLRGVTEDLGAPVAAGLRSFLEQPGVPRIAATLRCAAGAPPRIELSQQRSLPAGITDPEPRLWNLPVCLRHGDARSSVRQCITLTTATATVALTGAPAAGKTADRPQAPLTGCPTWTILNADAIGYYRSVVDPAAVRALFTPGSAIAKAARPTPAERMMLVEDLRAAVVRGELALDKLLALVPVIAADRDDMVARSALAAAALPLRGLDDATYHAAQRWYQRTFHARAARLGWLRGEKDSEELHQLRREIVPLVAVEDRALAAEARRLAERWLTDRTGLPDDLVAPALGIAARQGDAAWFERTLAAARTARDRTEHALIVGTLGAFTDPALARRALELLRGTELDLRDSLAIVYGVLGRRETRDVGLAFLAEHLDELLARMRSDDAAGFLGRLTHSVCDPERRAKLAAIVAPRADKIDGARSKVSRGLEQADQCTALVQRQLPALRRALR
jgi:aminopeptidase N